MTIPGQFLATINTDEAYFNALMPIMAAA